jgi:hypothetical protein
MAGVEPASRRFEPECATSLVALLRLAGAAPEQQGSTQASRCGAYGIPASGPSYRRPWAGTPGLLTPAAFPPGAGKCGRDRRCGQATLDAGLRSQGEGGRLCSCFGTLGLPSFIAVRAPRLAIRTQPPLSRPFHPQVPLVQATLYHIVARNTSFGGSTAAGQTAHRVSMPPRSAQRTGVAEPAKCEGLSGRQPQVSHNLCRTGTQAATEQGQNAHAAMAEASPSAPQGLLRL